MKLAPPKLLLVVLAVIFVALGIMLLIAIHLGDPTPNDGNDSDVESNSAPVPGLVLVR
jgi:hypothetical protein